MEGEFVLFIHEDLHTIGSSEEIRQNIINLRLEGYNDEHISAFINESGEQSIYYYWEEGEELSLDDFFY